jgi:hypothetical protein
MTTHVIPSKDHYGTAKEAHEDAKLAAVESQPMTLAQILETLQAADDALIEMTTDQMAELGALLAQKVDGYRLVLTKMEAEEKRLREEAAAFLKPAQALAKAQDRLKGAMIYHMVKHNMTRIPGESWRVDLKETKAVETPQEKPTSDDQWNYPDFVRQKFEWDKVALKAALERDDPKAKEIARIVINMTPAFAVNKKEIE